MNLKQIEPELACFALNQPVLRYSIYKDLFRKGRKNRKNKLNVRPKNGFNLYRKLGFINYLLIFYIIYHRKIFGSLILESQSMRACVWARNRGAFFMGPGCGVQHFRPKLKG